MLHDMFAIKIWTLVILYASGSNNFQLLPIYLHLSYEILMLRMLLENVLTIISTIFAVDIA